MNCKTCKYWTPTVDMAKTLYENKEYIIMHGCKNAKNDIKPDGYIGQMGECAKIDDPVIGLNQIKSLDSCYSGLFVTGEDFGCIHWSKNDNS